MSDDKATFAANKKRFLGAWPAIAEELTGYLKDAKMPENAIQWFTKSLDYNTPGGKLNRGISVVDTVEILLGKQLEGEEYYKVAILGWCIELLQAFFLVSDDIMDQSVTRRSQPCWYRVQESGIPPISHVGNIAINDAFMLEASIYQLLRRHFKSHPCYVQFFETFQDVTFKTEMGQLIDLITAPEDKVDLSQFNLQRHSLIVIYKTAYYSFYLPVALGMYYVGITSPALHEQAQSILIPMGEYFQIQDDYLDAFGTPEQIGKIGTDIIDNKCAWPINIALQKATPEQRRILDENYGVKNSDAEARVKKLYHELEIPAIYQKYEQESHARVSKQIEQVNETPVDGAPVAMKREVYAAFLRKIYARAK